MHRHRRPPIVATLFVAIVPLLSLATLVRPAAAGSNLIAVTTPDDELNTDGDCSLREAVVAANTNAPVDACPAGVPGDGDVIKLEPVAYVLTLEGRDEEGAATGDLDLLERVWIEGTQGGTRIDASGLDRVFDVAPRVTAILQGLELVNGDAAGAAGGAISARGDCSGSNTPMVAFWDGVIRDSAAAAGGGIHSGPCRNLIVRDGAIVNNVATLTGGGVAVDGATSLTLENVTISGNAAGEAGGGVWHSTGPGELYQSWIWTTIARNAAPEGAGFWSEGDAPYLQRSIVGENDGPDCFGLSSSFFAYVVADDASCISPDWAPSHPALGPLTMVRPAGEPDLGGSFTFVHPLLPESDAIDIEPDPDCGYGWSPDQAHNPRPQDGNADGRRECDAGAFEAATGTAPTPPPPSSGPEPPLGGGGAPPALPDTAVPEPEKGVTTASPQRLMNARSPGAPR